MLLARCQAEIQGEKKPDELCLHEQQDKPSISIEEWRQKIPAHVERVQRARRSRALGSYEQAVERNRSETYQEIARFWCDRTNHSALAESRHLP